MRPKTKISAPTISPTRRRRSPACGRSLARTESFKGIKPKNPGLNAGAWELALRYSTLEVDDSAFDLGFSDPAKNVQQADEAAIGVNWVITQNVKLSANYTHTQFRRRRRERRRPRRRRSVLDTRATQLLITRH